MSQFEASNLFSIKGQVAVVTGGGSGLGRSMAQVLAVNGASRVFIVGRRLETLQETAVLGPQGTIIPVTGDISSKESLQAAYETIASQTGHVDLLVANSGVLGPNTRLPIKPDGSFPRETIPLTRGGKEEEISGLILFMSSTAGGYLNGSIIVTDGGRLSVLPSAY